MLIFGPTNFSQHIGSTNWDNTVSGAQGFKTQWVQTQTRQVKTKHIGSKHMESKHIESIHPGSPRWVRTLGPHVGFPHWVPINTL